MKISIGIVKALIFICILVDVSAWSAIIIALLKWAFLTLGTMFWPIAAVVVTTSFAVLILIGIVSKNCYTLLKRRMF